MDYQAGVESVFTMMPALMSTAGFVLHSCGVMNSFNTLSYEKYLLDEQNIEMMMKMVNGMEIHDGEEELDNISEVGPGGQYSVEEHTMDYMYTELYTPQLFNKMGYASWANEGKKEAAQRAAEKIEDRLNSYQPQDLTKDQEAVLKEYIGDLYETI